MFDNCDPLSGLILPYPVDMTPRPAQPEDNGVPEVEEGFSTDVA